MRGSTGKLLSRVDTVNYLALSGGGADGAFGAGYLVGWADDDLLPDFHVVTGVSAGALLATHAFTGDVGALDRFDKVEESDLVSRRFPLFAIFSDSLLSNAPLREEIEALITPQILEAVASKTRGGGVLLVGVVDLDSGRFQQIDLGSIALEFDDNSNKDYRNQLRQRYIDTVLASTAIPIAFSPTYIDCTMFVDGGVRNQIFVEATLNSILAMKGMTIQELSSSNDEPIRVFALVNGVVTLDLNTDKEPIAKPNLISIGGRTISTVIDSSLDNDLHRICNAAFADSVELISMDLIETEVRESCEKLEEDIFDGDYMSCIFAEGIKLGSTYATRDCEI